LSLKDLKKLKGVILLANCTDYIKNDINAITAQQDEGHARPTVVHENVCVQGVVTITPSVVSGESKSFCLGNPIICSCPCGCHKQLHKFCTFVVSQNICVQIPLTFSATASAIPNGVACGTPGTGVCANGHA